MANTTMVVRMQIAVAMGFALILSSACFAGDDTGTPVNMRGADGIRLISK